MSAFPSTLLIRQSKHRAKIGAPKAVHYRNGLFDIASDLEAMIEAYGVKNVKSWAEQLEQRRLREMHNYPENFKPWRV